MGVAISNFSMQDLVVHISYIIQYKILSQMFKVFYTVAQNLQTACTMECRLEGCGHPWIPTWTRLCYGQISIETATHSFDATIK